jgi:CBS domain-containing protein
VYSTKRSTEDGIGFVRDRHAARLAIAANVHQSNGFSSSAMRAPSRSRAFPLARRGTWPAAAFVMHGDASNGLLRRALGRLMSVAIRKLSTAARKLGTPVLTTIPVSAAMLTALPVVKSEEALADVAQLFLGGRNHELAVVEDGHPVGVVTRDDVAMGLERRGPDARVGEAPQHDVLTVTPSDSLADVFDQLSASPDSVAIVIDRGEPVGLLTFEKLAAYIEHARLA